MCTYTCVHVRQGSICYTIAKTYNTFGAYTKAYYLSAVINYKTVFIMNEITFLKVGEAGIDNPPHAISFSPADVADVAVGVYSTLLIEVELL